MKKVKHYNSHPSGVEAKEIIRHLPFQLSNIFKYVIRRDFKGKPIEDLEKSLDYIEWEREEVSIFPDSDIPSYDEVEILNKVRKMMYEEENKYVSAFLYCYSNYLFSPHSLYLDRMELHIKDLIKEYQ